jgi:peptide/nickel transport system ATP-binding protein
MESCLGRDSKSDTVLLRAEQLKVYYPIRKGLLQRVVDHVRAVDGVNFQLLTGKTLALVGESGCGKTTLAKAMVNLLPITAGQLLFNDKDWLALAAKDRRQLYSQIQIVFQDPFAAMNPRLLVGDIIAEGLKALRPDLSEQQQNLTVQNLLQQVGLAADSAWRYPHEFSGGQRQRICIARALAVEPKLIILDEPTSALDVSVQGQIIELLKRLQQERQISYLLITHNLGVVAEMAHQVAVMYQGRLVEQGDVEQVLMQPSHPYTQQLLDAVPKLDSSGTVSLN